MEKSDDALKPELTDLSRRVSGISDAAREISHGLYPAQLEYLGFQKALKRLCEEVQRGQHLSVHLTPKQFARPVATLYVAFPISCCARSFA